MCLYLLVHDLFSFSSVFIVLWLSWDILFCIILYPYDAINRNIQMFYGRYSLNRNTTSPVEIFAFNFCLLDLQCTSPYPNDIPSLVWIFRLGCTPYVTSTHVYSLLRLSSPSTLLSLILCFINCITRLKFALYSTVLLVNLVHSNDIAGSISGLPLFCYPY